MPGWYSWQSFDFIAGLGKINFVWLSYDLFRLKVGNGGKRVEQIGGDEELYLCCSLSISRFYFLA